MIKAAFPNKPSANVQESALAADSPLAENDTPEIDLTPFWLLAAGTARKLGLRSEGGLNYQVLADHDRNNLFIALTKNDGGGFYSKERVSMRAIGACLDPYKAGTPFPSKALKGAYKSRSINNAGFISATLHALGLIAAAPGAKTKHIVAGDWAEWQKKMLSKAGTIIDLPAENSGNNAVETAPELDHKEHKKTLSLPRKK